MCYLVTGINTSQRSTASRAHVCYDTEAEAKDYAEALLKAGHIEVAIWKQVAVPTVKQVVDWETKDA